MAGNDTPLTPAQQKAYVARIKAAWDALPSDAQAQIKPVIEEGHNQLARFLAGGPPPDHQYHNVLRMKSYLTDDWDGHLKTLATPGAVQVTVSPDGSIVGFGKYETLDYMWEFDAGLLWLENFLHKHKFPPGMPAKPVPIPDNVTIAMAGDFGTGNFGASDAPAVKISKFIPSLKPYITIHLGDVYYAGTSDQETDNLLTQWPRGSFASFTMNSNHEMYPGGGPYFDVAVGNPIFNKYQSPWSFFALENSNWMIVALDSAYYSSVVTVYMIGSIGKNNAQIQFLQNCAQVCMKENKKLILVTHHNGIPEQGGTPEPLFNEVITALKGLPPPMYWYWGHAHAGVVYQPLKNANGMLCRCLGHAALPWGFASELANNDCVLWYEKTSAGDPDNKLRVMNGFVLLQLNGPQLSETFYNENGGVAWSSPVKPAAPIPES
jgi:hypothetical protein